MTRNEFKKFFNLTDIDAGMEYADEQYEAGMSWEEIAEAEIAAMQWAMHEV